MPLDNSQHMEENASGGFPKSRSLRFIPGSQMGKGGLPRCLRRIKAQNVGSWRWRKCIVIGLTFYVLFAQHFRSTKSDIVYCEGNSVTFLI